MEPRRAFRYGRQFAIVNMVQLPGFFVWLFLFGTGFCEETTAPNSAGELVSEIVSMECPGFCIEMESACTDVLNNTDCEQDFKCCIDQEMGTSTVEFDWQSTTQASEESSTFEENVIEEAIEDAEAQVEEVIEGQGLFEYYSQSEPETEVQDLSCPGSCIPDEYAKFCEYIVPSEEMCSSGTTCCVTEKEAISLQSRADQEIEEEPEMEFRSSQVQVCPGTCIHPAYAMFCENVLHDYPCPKNGKCCVKQPSTPNESPDSSIVDCTGQCLALHLHSYCFPPNELIRSPTTCAPGTTCCMRRSSKTRRQSFLSPFVNRMKFPSQSAPLQTQQPNNVLGYLATDDLGNIFHIYPNGQISPLPVLKPQDYMMQLYSKISEFVSPRGKTVVFSDKNGVLYQQFHPHRPNVGSSLNPQTFNRVSQFLHGATLNVAPQTSQMSAAFHEPEKEKQAEDNVKANSDEIVIPDDDDEAPKPSGSPVQNEDDTNRPPCPGSCMSYFLRFTCFRGYAIYDGFSCPGRSVCCATLKDIEEHEQYLKSLSPYFSSTASPRDPNLPRCGIKGRRDTPRVIGGKEALPGEWCWQVALINEHNQYICGGALIDNSWVLTAAHCVSGPLTENKAIYIRAGVTDLKSAEDNAASQTIRVMSTFIHHNFNSINLDNDIAILRLQKPLQLDDNICVVCLPTSGQMPKDNTKCTVTGYGFVSKGGEMSLKLREAKVPIVHDMDCMANVTEALASPFILPASSFCAGGHGLQDACQGDAGGPLVCEIGGFHELIGLVSWSLGCGRSDVSSIYVKVPAFMGWINQIISSSSFLTSLNR